MLAVSIIVNNPESQPIPQPRQPRAPPAKPPLIYLHPFRISLPRSKPYFSPSSSEQHLQTPDFRSFSQSNLLRRRNYPENSTAQSRFLPVHFHSPAGASNEKAAEPALGSEIMRVPGGPRIWRCVLPVMVVTVALLQFLYYRGAVLPGSDCSSIGKTSCSDVLLLVGFCCDFDDDTLECLNWFLS